MGLEYAGRWLCFLRGELSEELEELEGKFGDRFKAVYTVSRPGEESPFRKGYVTRELLEQVTGRVGVESKVFVCGPPAIVERIR